MPKFTEEVGDVNVGMFSPQSFSVDTSRADTIKRVGGLALEAHSGFRQADLAKDMQQLQAEFEVETDPILNPTEQKELTSFSERIEALQQQADATGQVDRFKVRAEALLKQHINRVPGLASELRKKASTVLGFDPTGEDLKQRMAEITEVADTAEAQMKRIDTDAVSLLGVAPGEVLSSKAVQEEYYQATKLRGLVKQGDLLRQHAANLKALGQTQVSPAEQLIRDVPNMVALNQVEAGALIKNTLRGFGFTDADIKAAGRDFIGKLTDEQKTALRGAIESVKAQKANELFTLRGSFDSNELYNATEERILAPYDNLMGIFDGSKAVADVEANTRLKLAAVEADLINDPGYILMQSWADRIPGIDFPAAKAAQVANRAWLALGASVFDPKADPATKYTQEDANKLHPAVVEDYWNNFVTSMEELGKGDSQSPGQKEMVLGAIGNFVSVMESPNLQHRGDVMKAFYKSLSDPKKMDLIKQAAEFNPEVSNMMMGLGAKVLNSTANKIRNQIRGTLSDNQRLKVNVNNGVISFSADTEGVQNPRQAKTLRDRARTLNQHLGETINSTIRVTSELSGRSPEEILDSVGGMQGLIPPQVVEEETAQPRATGQMARSSKVKSAEESIREVNEAVRAKLDQEALDEEPLDTTGFSDFERDMATRLKKEAMFNEDILAIIEKHRERAAKRGQ